MLEKPKILSKLDDLDEFVDGEYTFKSPENFSIKLVNFESIDSSHILVCFNAAVADRSKKIGPFYSGLGLANKLKIPTISFSDYIVTNNSNVSLGWYCGGEENLDFQSSIASFLDRVAQMLSKKLIILGGSGGGFASLAISSMLKSSATIISMNPQTSITMYHEEYVQKYMRAAFTKKILYIKDCEKYLTDKGIVNNICDIEYHSNIKVLYLQNKADRGHVKKHLSNFIKNKNMFPWGDNSYSISENIGIYLGGWQGRHTSPPISTILKIIEMCIEGTSIPILLRFLENGADNTIPNKFDLMLLNNYDCKLQVNVIPTDETLKLQVDLFRKGRLVESVENIRFAVYVLSVKNEILKKFPYHEKIPNIPVIEGYSRIKVFAKDDFGKTIVGFSKRLQHPTPPIKH